MRKKLNLNLILTCNIYVYEQNPERDFVFLSLHGVFNSLFLDVQFSWQMWVISHKSHDWFNYKNNYYVGPNNKQISMTQLGNIMLI